MGTVHAKAAEHCTRDDEKVSDGLRDNIPLKEIPVKVQKIHFDGLQRTKDDFLVAQSKPLFDSSNFEEMLRHAESLRVSMESIGVFKRSEVFVDVSSGPDARSDGYEITYKVKETRRLGGSVSTLVGTNDGSVMFQMKLPHVLGRGERIAANYVIGTGHNKSNQITFYKPLLGNLNFSFLTGFFQHQTDYHWSGFKEQIRGLHIDIGIPSILGAHVFKWHGQWRDIGVLEPTTSFAVREQSGHSVKSSFEHKYEYSTQDSPVLPTKGLFLKIVQELAGIGGDTSFLKQDLHVRASQPLFYGLSLQMSLGAGMMKPLFPDEKVKICDKFFIGGPLTLRGFNFNGCGPHEEGDALGADTYYVSGLHLYSPLPFLPSEGGFSNLVKTHLFVNAGNLFNSESLNGTWKENVDRLINTTRISYGAGIVMKLGDIARVEINYCIPFRAQLQDSAITKGIQFGIGVKFL